jgi:diguanylate cyclase (GGDEF)-like protein
MHSIAQTNPEQIPDLTVIANNSQNNARQQQLTHAIQSLSLELQQTLVLDKLLHFFCEKVVNLVPCDSVRYSNAELDLSWQHGNSQEHSCLYQLNLNGANLGEVVCTRSNPFSDEDLQVIEWLVAILIYPVKNALLYKRALDASLKDGLTGAANRSAYDESLERDLAKSRRNNKNLSLLVIDIDNFKNFNDNFGHALGDKVLQSVSQEIQQNLRTSDRLFRYGGEEFTVILSDTNGDLASIIAERLRTAIANLIISENHINHSVTISIGAAETKSTDDSESLFERADEALYNAKKTGRNKVELAA